MSREIITLLASLFQEKRKNSAVTIYACIKKNARNSYTFIDKKNTQ